MSERRNLSFWLRNWKGIVCEETLHKRKSGPIDMVGIGAFNKPFKLLIKLRNHNKV